ncbi:Uncharacterised protein [Vibrio cholerae]|nr:Uncharacterised protein [Vibrio cholerae]CSI57044.1 Uncharacterised protein [Vibrio cholerae]
MRTAAEPSRVYWLKRNPVVPLQYRNRFVLRAHQNCRPVPRGY